MLGTTHALNKPLKQDFPVCLCMCVDMCVHEQSMNHISLKKEQTLCKVTHYTGHNAALVCAFTTGFVCVHTCLSAYSCSSVTRYIQC